MGFAWERFEWSGGGDRYSFAITDGGLYGTLSASGRADVTLPMVAWEGMLEAMRTNRKAKDKSHAVLPPRAGALWSEAEAAQLAVSFNEGKSVAQLAVAHARTPGAITSQLERLGLVEARFALEAGRARAVADQARPERDAYSQPAPGVTGAAATMAAKPTSTEVNAKAVRTNA